MYCRHMFIWDQYEEYDKDDLAHDVIIVPNCMNGCAVISMDDLDTDAGTVTCQIVKDCSVEEMREIYCDGSVYCDDGDVERYTLTDGQMRMALLILFTISQRKCLEAKKLMAKKAGH